MYTPLHNKLLNYLYNYIYTSLLLPPLYTLRFRQACTHMITNQPILLHTPLITSFEKFLNSTTTTSTSTTSTSSVQQVQQYNFTNITKINRILFIKKFRLFVMELRSIVIFA